MKLKSYKVTGRGESHTTFDPVCGDLTRHDRLVLIVADTSVQGAVAAFRAAYPNADRVKAELLKTLGELR